MVNLACKMIQTDKFRIKVLDKPFTLLLLMLAFAGLMAYQTERKTTVRGAPTKRTMKVPLIPGQKPNRTKPY